MQHSGKKTCGIRGIAFGYIILATLFERMGEFNAALSALDSSQIFKIDLYSEAESRARVLTKMGKIDSALVWQTIAVQSQSEFPGDIFEPGWVYQDRGNLYQKKGELASACADWQKALELGLEDAKPKLDSFCASRR